MAKSADPLQKAFDEAVLNAGFVQLGGSADRFIDLRFHKPGRYVLPVKDREGRLLFHETLRALLDSRAAYQREKQAAEVAQARKVAAAAKIAPQAIPPARARLTGTKAISVLADDLREAASRGTGVGRPDMLRLGWTMAQLEQYERLACQTADRLAVAHV